MLILNDVLDIADRLKEIDPAYTLHYNPQTGRYELHGAEDEVVIIFPYDRADERMIRHARKTRRERIDALLEEIERANAAAEATANRAQSARIEDILREGADKYYVERRRAGDA